MKKPRLLFLTTRPPYPLHGGDVLRAYRLAQVLSKGFDIELLALSDQTALAEPIVRAGVLQPDGPFSSVELIDLPRWRSAVQAAGAIFTKETPMQLAYYHSAKFARRVRELSQRSDAVFCHLIRTAPFAADLKLPKVLEYTDALSMFYERVMLSQGTTVSAKALAYRIEQPRVLAYELEAARQFDLLTFASDVDRQWLVSRAPDIADKCMAAPNGVTLHPWASPKTRRGSSIAFIGNMRTLQNQDAANYFASEAMPRLAQRFPKMRFKVIGSSSADVKKRLEGFPNVDVVGVVDDLGAGLADCFTGVCPMRLGAGIQNKVLDYMSHSLPVVSSTLGMAGLGQLAHVNRTHLQADSADQYVDAVTSLYLHPDLRDDLSSHAHRMVEAHFGWESNLRPILSELESKVGVRIIEPRATGRSTVRATR